MLWDDRGFLRQGPVADKARAAFQPSISCLLQSDHCAAFFPVKGIKWESPFLPSGGLGSISEHEGLPYQEKFLPCTAWQTAQPCATCICVLRQEEMLVEGALLCKVLGTDNTVMTTWSRLYGLEALMSCNGAPASGRCGDRGCMVCIVQSIHQHLSL